MQRAGACGGGTRPGGGRGRPTGSASGRWTDRGRRLAGAPVVTPLEILRFSGAALTGHRLRTGLTLLGVAIGVAAVILLTALGEGARLYVTGEFASLGSSLLLVLPGKVETSGSAPIVGGTPRDLTLQDAEAVLRRCRQVRRVAPISVGSARVGYGDRRREVTILGGTPDLLPVRHLELAVGRFLPDIDPDPAAPVAVIGRRVQEELFGAENPLGKPIRIGDRRFRVSGVMGGKGTSLGMNMDEIVIVPAASGRKLSNQTSLFRVLTQG